MMAKNNINVLPPHLAHYDTQGEITANTNEVDNVNWLSQVTRVSEWMMGHSSLSASLRHKAMTFARYVNEYAPHEWISYFTTYIRDTPFTWLDDGGSSSNNINYNHSGECNESNALTQLWCDVSDIFDELHRSSMNATQTSHTPAVKTEMRYVSASRRVL